jgi:hypothetical protein
MVLEVCVFYYSICFHAGYHKGARVINEGMLVAEVGSQLAFARHRLVKTGPKSSQRLAIYIVAFIVT